MNVQLFPELFFYFLSEAGRFSVESPLAFCLRFFCTFFLTVCFSAPSGALVGQMWTVRAPRSPVRPRGLTYRAGSAPRLVESPLAFRSGGLRTFDLK